MLKVVFKDFAKFTRKHLYCSLFFNKVVGLSNFRDALKMKPL